MSRPKRKTPPAKRQAPKPEPANERKKEAAIAALLTERTQAAAARKAKISLATLKRWLKEAAFAKAYKAARSEWFDSVLQDLERVAKKSIVTLDQAMKAKKPADRIRAALGLLSHAFKAKEQFELEERLEALEERLRSEGAK